MNKTEINRLSRTPSELVCAYGIEKRNQRTAVNQDLTTRACFGLGDVVACHPRRVRNPKSPATVFFIVSKFRILPTAFSLFACT